MSVRSALLKHKKIEPRGVSIEDAAAYAGLTVRGYKNCVQRKLFPGPMVDPATGRATNRYDLRAIDLAMDRMSGIEPDVVSRKPSPFEEWEASLNEGGAEAHPHDQEEAG